MVETREHGALSSRNNHCGLHAQGHGVKSKQDQKRSQAMIQSVHGGIEWARSCRTNPSSREFSQPK